MSELDSTSGCRSTFANRSTTMNRRFFSARSAMTSVNLNRSNTSIAEENELTYSVRFASSPSGSASSVFSVNFEVL